MKIHKSIYKVFFIIALMLQLYIDSVEFIVMFTAFISFLLLLESKVKLSKTAFNTINILSSILVIGFIIGLFKPFTLFDKIRDLVHFIKPITVILSGYLLVRKIKNSTFVLKTIVFLALLIAIYHLISLFFIDFNLGTIEEIRLKAGAGNFIELLALIILITMNKEFKIINNIPIKKLSLILISTSSFLYFSRTMLLGFVLLLMTIYGFTKLSRKMIEYSTLILILIGGFYAYLFSIKIEPDKPGINNFIFKIKNAPAEIFLTPEGYNPRNHKNIFKHWRGYEASMALNKMNENKISYLTGSGFGSLIDLKFSAPLGGKNGLRYIPHLHNGYAYILFKTGVFGLLLYLVLLLNLYKQLYVVNFSNKEKMHRYLIAGLGIYYFASTFVITGLYNLGEISIFLLGVFLYLSSFEKQNSFTLNE